MAQPKFRIYRKTKQGKKGTDGVCGVIWEQEGKGNGTFLSLQFFPEANEKYKQVAFGKYDPDTYFYNVYENTPKDGRLADKGPKDEAWEEDEEEEEF